MTSWIESIDVNAYVKQLMKNESLKITEVAQNKIAQLNKSEGALKTKLSSYGQLQNLLDTFQQSLQTISTDFNPSYQVSSSNTNVATAAISGSVSPGNHVINITQLAQAEQVASSVFNVASDSTALNMTNTVTISVGSANFNLSIGSGDSLQTIANNINVGAAANNVGAFASVVSTASGQYQLIISSNQTGTANAVSISETGTGSNALNISTGAGGTGTILSNAQDAKFTLDSLNYDMPTNSNTIAGLNLNLLSIGSATFSVTQTNSVDNVNQAIQNSVDAYNQIMTFIAQTQVQEGMPDSVLSLIQTSLTNIMSNSSVLISLGISPIPYDQVQPISGTTANGDPISIHPRGLLAINPDPVTGQTLASKLAANFSSIQSQLFGNNGVFTQAINALTMGTGSIWEILNDTQSGGVTLANNQINQLDQQIQTVQTNLQNQKNELVKKYAQLDMLLSNLQVKSQYITQQLALMSNNKTN